MFRRVSPYVQFALVALLILMFLLSGRHRLAPAAARRRQPPRGLLLSAALVSGSLSDAIGLDQSRLSGTGLIRAHGRRIDAVAALAAYLLSYKRHVTRSLESADDPSHEPSALERVVGRLLDRFVVRRSLEQAAFYFIWKTLMRSRRHKLLFAAYVAAGCALIFEGLAVLVARGGNSWMYHPIPELLPAPLILSFFMLCGMRHVFAVPAELRANWVFQVSDRGEARTLSGRRQESHDRPRRGSAVRSAAAAPRAVLGMAHRPAPHRLSAPYVSYLLVEVLLVSFEKFPFTCSYLPGKANLKVSWPIYLFAFTTYISAFLTLEYWMLQRPLRFLWLLAVSRRSARGVGRLPLARRPGRHAGVRRSAGAAGAHPQPLDVSRNGG